MSEESNSLGSCGKCGDDVFRDGSGCSTSSNEVYHIACFTCAVCAQQLLGSHFYTINGELHCEKDYQELLDKCDACNKPIEDRVITTRGKKFHQDCFRCEVCEKSLDNVPFVWSPNEEILCIEDYHKKYAPRCSVCKEPIAPEPGSEETVQIVALDRSFHVGCYKCEDCHLQLSSEGGVGCFPLDGHVLCRECNRKRSSGAQE